MQIAFLFEYLPAVVNIWNTIIIIDVIESKFVYP